MYLFLISFLVRKEKTARLFSFFPVGQEEVLSLIFFGIDIYTGGKNWAQFSNVSCWFGTRNKYLPTVAIIMPSSWTTHVFVTRRGAAFRKMRALLSLSIHKRQHIFSSFWSKCGPIGVTYHKSLQAQNGLVNRCWFANLRLQEYSPMDIWELDGQKTRQV